MTRIKNQQESDDDVGNNNTLRRVDNEAAMRYESSTIERIVEGN